MKAVHKIVAGLAVAGLAVTAAIAARPIPTSKQSKKADGPAQGVAAAGVGISYTTGFEPVEGFPLGYINNGGGTPAGCGGIAFPCWGHTAGAGFSLITPTIENVHPDTGTQHLRVVHDPTTRTNIPNFGLGVDARYPRTADLSAHPDAPNTVSVEMSISNPFGQDFVMQPQSNSMGSSQTITLFFYTGAIYVVDDLCNTVGAAYQPTGAFWDTLGGYQNFMVEQDPCNNHVVHSYAGAVIMDTCIWNGTRLDQFLVFGDNYPGSMIDVDNLLMSSEDECLSICGNGTIEPPNETCDVGSDAACPGRCIGAGLPGECTCTPICTEAAPCPVVNGTNGPFLSSDGFYSYNSTSPFLSIDSCGSNYDSSITVHTVADPGTELAYNDNCNGGQFGADADPTASCYDGVAPFDNLYPSCLCMDNPGEPIIIQVDAFGAPAGDGSSTTVTIRKKSVCQGPLVGACCDTNGADQGCDDDVTEAACTGPDKVWTSNGKCAGVTCVCIPMCGPAPACGDDGCGGSCGTCGDGNLCNGEETCQLGQCVPGTPLVCNDGNACNGVETCNPSSGCVPGTPLSCNNGQFCDGTETCNPSSGCVPGTPPNCDDGVACTADSCDEAADACVNDDADCAIPTVSEWGLVVLTLMLLIGAKVYFGRRQAIA